MVGKFAWSEGGGGIEGLKLAQSGSGDRNGIALGLG